MTFEEIIKDIRARKFAPIYFLHGEEAYFIDQIEEALDAAVLTEAEKGFNQTVLYGKDVDHLTLLDYLRRYPMMSQHQVVILREAQEMKTLPELAPYAENPMPSTVFIVCHKHKKVDGRSKLATALKKKAVVFESKKLYDNQIPDWIVGFCKQRKLLVESPAAALLAEYLGTDLAKIANELNKLALNLPAGMAINLGHIQQYVGISKDYNIFELQKAMATRDMGKIARIQQHFEANIKKNPLIPTISSLFNFFSKVLLLHELNAKRSPESEILSTLDLRSEWFLRDYKAAAMNFSPGKTMEIIGLLRAFDLRSKGVETDTTNTGEEQLMKELFFQILH